MLGSRALPPKIALGARDRPENGDCGACAVSRAMLSFMFTSAARNER